jgi:hypothetical protein
MGLFDKKMQDPIPGSARVIDNDGLRSIPGQSIHCPLDLLVSADGIAPYMIHVKVRPKTGKWPHLNQVLPVIIDRSDPSRVEIVWDQIQSLQEQIEAGKAQRMAAAQQSVAAGTPQDLMRQAMVDPAAFVEKMRASMPQAAAAPPAAASPDVVDQIAKLADLHSRGALTDDEFQAMKKRILGG